MGWKYTVETWGDHLGTGERTYSVHWGGSSFARALWELWRATKLGYGCVKLECR
jgi:hypothetical protein